MKKTYQLSISTQGPLYPPSEILDQAGDFITIGYLNVLNPETQQCHRTWGAALVSQNSPLPPFGESKRYEIIRYLDVDNLAADKEMVLYTLPYPIPCHNYPMVFAPDQIELTRCTRPSYPFHLAPIPDVRPQDGRKCSQPITLGQWVQAKGEVTVSVTPDKKAALFVFELSGLIPNSLYTIMALREHDLDPAGPTRPGPLGVPNVFIADEEGRGKYQALMPNPFPSLSIPFNQRHRITNVVVLWMSSQMNCGGAIGHFGLGVDIHAQLKLQVPSFLEFETI